MPAPYSKIDLRMDRPGASGQGWATTVSPNGSAPIVPLVVAVLVAGLMSGLLVIWRSLV